MLPFAKSPLACPDVTGTLIETPSSRYRLTVAASHSDQSIDMAAGKASIINGAIYYSPNCSRRVELPPNHEDFVYIRKTDQVDVADLHKPLWWSERTAYLAFLPLKPDYSFPFTDLFNLTFRRKKEVAILDTPVLLNWKKLENFIAEIIEDMRGHYGFPKPEPVMTTVVSTGIIFKNAKEFHEKVTRLQGWFAIWMAHLSYAIAIASTMDELMSAADSDCAFEPRRYFRREDEVPEWILRLCKHGKWDQAFISGLNTSVARFTPDFDRVGAFLDTSFAPRADYNFPIDFLLHFNVPVWYRWDAAWARDPKLHPRIARLAPPPEHLQIATIFISKTPSTGERPWEVFFANRKIAEYFMLKAESPIDKQRRLSRERDNPYNHTTKVYVWEWGSDGNYVRRRVSQPHNAATLGEFGRHQKVYNSVFNEWDCGHDLGDLDEDEEDGSPILGADPGGEGSDDDLDDDTLQLSSHDLPLPSSGGMGVHDLSSPGFKTFASTTSLPDHTKTFEIVKFPVLQILFEYFGFVSPLPVPEEYPHHSHKLTENEIKQTSRVLGVEELDADFTRSVLMQYCYRFLSDLGDQKVLVPPSDLFDLSPDNRIHVGATMRHRFIKKVSADWYLLDLPLEVAQAPWKLAVSHPVIALLLCRLDEGMDEYGLCNALMQRGVEFRTFLPLQPIAPQPLPSLITPIRLSDYKFTYGDYECYLQDRDRLLSSPRVRRAALMRGGIIWRLAASQASVSEVVMGPTASVRDYRQGTVLSSTDPAGTFYDDCLSSSEMDALCGLVYCYTGESSETSYLTSS